MLKAVFLCGLVMILIGCGNDNSNVNNVKTNLDKNIVNQTKQPIVLTPDWSIAGVLTAIGNPPIATGDLRIYPQWSLKPALPSTTVDLGARFQPNPELMAQLEYDVVIDNDFYQHLRGNYGDKPILSFESGAKVGVAKTWQDYENETYKIAKFVNKIPEAKQYLADSQRQLKAFGQQFANNHPTVKKVAIVQFANANYLRNYTANSLFKPALDAMNVGMYEHGEGNMWGNVDMTLADLASVPADTCLVVIEPYSPMLQQELANNALWQRLGYADGKRCLLVLPPIWLFGGVPSILAFAEFLANSKPYQSQIMKQGETHANYG